MFQSDRLIHIFEDTDIPEYFRTHHTNKLAFTRLQFKDMTNLTTGCTGPCQARLSSNGVFFSFLGGLPKGNKGHAEKKMQEDIEWNGSNYEKYASISGYKES